MSTGEYAGMKSLGNIASQAFGVVEALGKDAYVVLDTRAFDEALARKDGLIRAYNSLNEEYDRIVNTLLENWKGRGAKAFKKDATTVKTNIVGIFDNLTLLCDILTDCKDIFSECDAGLGEYNRNPDAASNDTGVSGTADTATARERANNYNAGGGGYSMGGGGEGAFGGGGGRR